MNKTTRTLLLAVIATAMVLLLIPRSKTADSSARRPADESGGAVNAETGRRSSTDASLRGTSSGRERSARDSLAGSDVAGGLLVDDDGNFYPTAEAIELFEYFLSTTGEKPLEDIIERIRDEIRRRLSPPADGQALAFLDRYLVYRERGVALGATDTGDEDLRARFERLRSLRREVFGDEIAARLWGDEEAAADVAIRQREVAVDPELSEADKAARIEQLYDELPEPMRETRRQALAAATLRADEAKILAEGGSEDDVHRLRVERFGEEAANRLADLDRSRAEWDSRVEDFRARRARILADSSLTEAERRAAVARLLEERFDDGERVRLEALDRIAAEAAARR